MARIRVEILYFRSRTATSDTLLRRIIAQWKTSTATLTPAVRCLLQWRRSRSYLAHPCGHSPRLNFASQGRSLAAQVCALCRSWPSLRRAIASFGTIGWFTGPVVASARHQGQQPNCRHSFERQCTSQCHPRSWQWRRPWRPGAWHCNKVLAMGESRWRIRATFVCSRLLSCRHPAHHPVPRKNFQNNIGYFSSGRHVPAPPLNPHQMSLVAWHLIRLRIFRSFRLIAPT